jgi:hypothetical protein
MQPMSIQKCLVIGVLSRKVSPRPFALRLWSFLYARDLHTMSFASRHKLFISMKASAIVESNLEPLKGLGVIERVMAQPLLVHCVINFVYQGLVLIQQLIQPGKLMVLTVILSRLAFWLHCVSDASFLVRQACFQIFRTQDLISVFLDAKL